IRAGRLLGARESGRALVLALRPRGGRDAETISADLVLRATGVEGGYRPGAVAAVDPLVAGGCLHPDPLGLGFAVDDDGRALNRDGRVVPGLYLLGAAARGRDWECTAIPELRRAAERIAIALSG